MTDQAAPQRELGFRPKMLLKAFWLPYFYLTFVVIALVWLVSHMLPLEGLSAQFRFSAACLQLVGLAVVIQGLWVKGEAFGRPNPVVAIRQFLTLVRLSFTKPRDVTLSLKDALAFGSSMELTVEARQDPQTLEERVSHLETELHAAKRRWSKEKEGIDARIRKLDASSSTRHRESMKQLKNLRESLEITVVGSYTLEWVAVVWLLVGMLQSVAAEIEI